MLASHSVASMQRAATISGRSVAAARTSAPSLAPLARRGAVRAMATKRDETASSSTASSSNSTLSMMNDMMLMSAAAATPFLLDVESAMAKGREFGIVEGRIFSLMHPAVLGSFFFVSLWAAYLGFQWREVRTIPATIKELKAELPAANAEGVVPPSEAGTKIAELEAKRKDLIKKKLNERHNAVGSLLLGGGTLFAVAGPVNTYLRTGKLFPGPHLYAGAAIVVLWALAASLTPAMQKGNDAARSAHIALNVVNIGLFAWQIPTGLDIVYKVFEFTTLP